MKRAPAARHASLIAMACAATERGARARWERARGGVAWRGSGGAVCGARCLTRLSPPAFGLAHLSQGHAGQHDDAKLSAEARRERARVHVDRDVLVELGEARRRHRGTPTTSVRFRQEELRREVCHLDWRVIMEGDGLDAAQHHVFGDLDAKPLEADDEHRCAGHAAHRLVAQHIQLSAVERLVDGGSRVNIHGVGGCHLRGSTQRTLRQTVTSGGEADCRRAGGPSIGRALAARLLTRWVVAER